VLGPSRGVFVDKDRDRVRYAPTLRSGGLLLVEWDRLADPPGQRLQLLNGEVVVNAAPRPAYQDEQTRIGTVPVTQLTVNRRQADPVERQPLTAFRDGQVADSQELRDQAGWEHHYPNPERTLVAMAAAVLNDLDAHGPDRVAALAVTHADCETLADRIRADLTEQGTIAGPGREGPGWAGPRTYQAADRILLHAHAHLPDGRRLTNGTVAPVTGTSAAGLEVMADSSREAACLPAAFVTGLTADSRPQVSHAYGPRRLQIARAQLAGQIRNAADRATPPDEGGPAAIIDDPVDALRDLDRAINQAAGRPGPQGTLRRTAAASPGPHIHVKHPHAAQTECPTASAPAPTIGI
jgi:hypothetical protein